MLLVDLFYGWFFDPAFGTMVEKQVFASPVSY